MKCNKVARTVAIIVLVLSLVGIAWLLYDASKPYIEAEKLMEDITAHQKVKEPQKSSEIDWEYWQRVNPAIVGWIIVRGTGINYPIVQASKSDPTYYLHHDIYKRYNIYGCPYVDAECDGLNDVAPIIYGHHMINGTMFSKFSKFTAKPYADNHAKILILTPNDKKDVSVAAARVVNAATTSKYTGFTAETFREYFDTKISGCSMQRGSVADDTIRVYTFVTCSYTRFKNERTLVYGTEKGTVSDALYNH